MKMAKQYKKKIIYEPQEPSVIVRLLPFWWFTDIAIQFRAGKTKETLIYGVYHNVLKSPLGNPSPYLEGIIAHSIQYSPEEYPEVRSFDDFPPKEGSPFYNGLKKLLKRKRCLLDDIKLIHATMRYCSRERGTAHVIDFLYNKRGKKEEFWREINDMDLMDFLDKGGVEYLDKTFER